MCIENGLGVLSYFSLASGFLTGNNKSRPTLQTRRGAISLKISELARLQDSRALNQVAKRLIQRLCR